MLLNFDANTPDDVPPPSRAHVVLALIIPLHTIAMILVALRILVKGKLRKLGVEDVFIVIAICTALALVVLTIIVRKYGFGGHTRDIHPDWILPYGKIFYIGIALGTCCYYFTKASMLFFYLTLATEPYLRKICYTIIAITSISSIIILFMNLFGCTPISGAWDRRPSHKSVCITGLPFYYYTALSNILIDIVLLVLPIPILLRMRLGWRVKLGLVMMFSMGFLVSGAAIVQFWSLCVSIYSTDIVWDGAYTWMLSILELNVGIMTACMPSMKLLFKWLRGEEQVRHEGDGTIGGGRRQPKMVQCGDPSLWSVGSGGSDTAGSAEMGQEGVVVSQEVLLESDV